MVFTWASVALLRQYLLAFVAHAHGIGPAARRHRHLARGARITETLATATAVMLVQAGSLKVCLARMALLQHFTSATINVFYSAWKLMCDCTLGAARTLTIISLFGFQ